MNAKTLEALKGSIEKWEGIVAGKIGDEGTNNCPLCLLFYYGITRCKGCIVSEESMAVGCNNTPYDNWCNFWNSFQYNETANCDESKQLAQDMLDFLKSLLPKGE